MTGREEKLVVVLAPVANDAAAVVAMLQAHGLEAEAGSSGAGVVALIDSGAGALLLTEEALGLADADVLLLALKAQPSWSELPVIILTTGGVGRLTQLLDLTAEAGAVTFLERPVATALLVRAVKGALGTRRRQYRTRQLLEEQRRREEQLQEAKARVERELAERRLAEEALGKWAMAQPETGGAALRRYGVALGVLTLCLGLRGLLTPAVQNLPSFTTLYAAVTVAVWFAGLWPAALVATSGYIAYNWAFVEPSRSFSFTQAALTGLGFYVVTAGLIIASGVTMRRAQGHARASARVAIERQRQAEQALAERDVEAEKARAADQRFHAALKNSRVMMAEFDRDLKYRWIYNPRPEVTATIPLGGRPEPGGPDEQTARLGELKKQVLTSGRGAALDVSFAAGDGDCAYSLTIDPLRDSDGEIVGVTLVGLDITDRKRAEEALRRSEEQARRQLAELDAIYREAPLGLTVLDTNLRFQRINDRMAEINGLAPADHLGKTIADVLPGLASEADRVLGEVMSTGKPVRFEFKGQTAAQPGVPRIWDVSWYPLREESGAISRVGAVVEEITERKKTEEALRASEQLFRGFAENVPQFTWMAMPDGTVFWFNRRWFDHTGATLEQVGGWKWRSLVHPEQVERVTTSLQEAIKRGGTWEDSFQLRGQDGAYRWYLSRAFPIRDAAGAVTRWFGAHTDITVLRETQEALREAQRRIRCYSEELEKTVADRTARLQETVHDLEAFSYSVAHDMRAPLRAMIAFAELVREEHATGIDATGRDYLRRISVSARRLDRLILDVLHYSAMARQELPLEPLDPAQIVHEVLDGYPNLAAERERVEVTGPIPAVFAHRAALTQVLSNLLANAVKFARPNVPPRVRIGGEPVELPAAGGAQRGVRVWVEDNGIGINPAARPLLFKMFQRLTPPDAYEGTGMGLAIARKAVERMGGSIAVDSAEGGGCRFSFTLRAAESAPASS